MFRFLNQMFNWFEFDNIQTIVGRILDGQISGQLRKVDYHLWENHCSPSKMVSLRK